MFNQILIYFDKNTRYAPQMKVNKVRATRLDKIYATRQNALRVVHKKRNTRQYAFKVYCKKRVLVLIPIL